MQLLVKVSQLQSPLHQPAPLFVVPPSKGHRAHVAACRIDPSEYRMQTSLAPTQLSTQKAAKHLSGRVLVHGHDLRDQ